MNSKYLKPLLTSALLLTAIAIILTMLGACKKYDGQKAASDRAQWLTSLRDSIALIEKARQEDSLRIASLRADIDTDISRFSQVANQREVAPYYILSTARGEYPLKSTGVIARVTDDMQYEVVAALAGQKFDAIRIRKTAAAEDAVTSTVVPPDQALNYTSNDGLTTVAFSGPLNSPLGRFVAENIEAPLSVEYLRNGGVCKSIPLSADRKNCLGASWRLTSSRSLLDSLENAQVLNARKLEILHITLARQK